MPAANVTRSVVDNMHVGPGTLEVEFGESEVLYAVTEEGGTLRFEQEMEYLEADETLGRLEAFLTGENASFEIAALEFDAEHLQLAMANGSVTTNDADEETAGSDELSFGGSFSIRVGSLTYTAPRRSNRNLNNIIELHRVVGQAEYEIQFQKTERTSYRARFEAMEDVSRPAGERIGKITIENEEPTGNGNGG